MSLACKRGVVDKYPQTKHMQCQLQRRTKTSSRRTNNIETLLERLGSLQIIEEISNDYKQMNTEMLEVPAPAAISKNIQVGML